MSMNEDRCGNCRFALNLGSELDAGKPSLRCRYDPPRHFVEIKSDDSPGFTAYPMLMPVFANGWCGKHEKVAQA